MEQGDGKVVRRSRAAHRFGRAPLAALLLGLGGVPALAATAEAAPTTVCTTTTCTVTYTEVGYGQTFTVPSGVALVSFEVVGGRGANGSRGSAGGAGAVVTGSLVPTPGSMLTVDVGQVGQTDRKPTVGGGGPSFEGGGGGASDIAIGSTPVAVAGGGGGGGSDGFGTDCDSQSYSVAGGAGGNADSAGGTGATANVGGSLVLTGGGGGGAGGATNPGGGGASGTASGECPVRMHKTYDPVSSYPGQGGTGGDSLGGGGGGGGYRGGGAGGCPQVVVMDGDFNGSGGGYGGGGGGSSYLAPTVLNGSTVSAGNDGSINGGNGRITLTYVQPLPKLSVGDATVTEGAFGARTNATFTITLSAASLVSTTVDYATADGTATAPGDYTATSGQATIAAGATSTTVTVPVVGDPFDEPDETFSLNLSNPSTGASIADGQGNGTITDDDAPPPKGKPYAWGFDEHGELGDATTAQFRVDPRPVLGLPAGTVVTAVAGAQFHSLALTSDGAVYAWGDGGRSQLGQGTDTTKKTTAVPVQGLPTNDPVVRIAAGDFHSAVLTASGRVYTFGFNKDGQLGDGSRSNRGRPTLVTGFPTGATISAIAAGDGDTYAVTTDGAVYAWGASTDGALGDGSGTDQPTPVLVKGLPAGTVVTSVVAGDLFGLALTDHGTVYGWGRDRKGALGTGPLVDRPTAAPVAGFPAGTTLATIVAGGEHSLALGNDGTVFAWGGNGDGQLGDGTRADNPTPTPVTFPAGTVVKAIGASATASYVVTAAGGIDAWGNNDRGELGDGTRARALRPVATALPAGSTALAVEAEATEGYHALAVLIPGPATVSIGDASVMEGNSGTTNAVFTVSLSAATDQPVTVDYTTADGTATHPGDYTATSGTATITAGATSTTVTVPVVGDTLDEADETFTVGLTNPVGATVADGQGTGTITDDDAPPTVSINGAQVSEGNSGTTNATFTVSVSAASGQAVTVHYDTSDGSAVSPSDYTATSGSLTIPVGSTSTTVVVPVVGDTLSESNETFEVHLSLPTNATLANAIGVGTIIDDDALPTLSIGDVRATEGNSGATNATFTISLSTASGQAVTVGYATADGTAAAPGDYTATSGAATIAAGMTSTTVTVPVVGDTVDEDDETFVVDLSNPSGASIARARATGTIVDDDPAPSLSIGDVRVNEGDSGTANATFTVSLSAASGRAVSVGYTTANGAAAAPGDYTSTSGTATIAVGQTSTTITVPVVGDRLDEDDETFTVNLSGPSNATIADAQGVGTIGDDDAAPTVSIGDTSVTEGNSGSTNATFTVSLAAVSGRAVSVGYATADGTAVAPGDYTPTSGTATIAAGQTSTTITVPVAGDRLDEDDETFTVNLSSPTNATIADGTGVATITDDDPPPTVSIGDVWVVEGDSGTTTAVFTVSLAAASGRAVTVRATTSDGTAQAPIDYAASTALVTIPAGQTSAAFDVPVKGDTTAEADETFTVTLSEPVHATVADASATGTIVDDDSMGTFVPVGPARVLDTRTGLGQPAPGKVGPGQTITVDVTGVGGVPQTGVAAVAVNVTSTEATSPSYLAVTPDGGRDTSTLTVTPGAAIATLAIVPVGPDGNVRVFNLTGSTHVVFDVVGWYETAGVPPASQYVPVGPTRVVDTRTGQGQPSAGPVGPGQTITVKVTGFGGVPETGVTAVALNVTATEPTASGYLSVTPSGGHDTSSLNFRPGQTVPNLVIVPVAPDGTVKIYGFAGSTHVVADFAGWFATPGSRDGDTLRTLTPTRIVDTRSGQGTDAGPLGRMETRTIHVAGAGGVPTGATGVVLQLTATRPTTPTYVSVTPTGATGTSNLNLVAGQTASNLVIVPVDANGDVQVFNHDGTTDIVLDVVAYLT